jgi:energy-converting hydrogenase Eha subunit C
MNSTPRIYPANALGYPFGAFKFNKIVKPLLMLGFFSAILASAYAYLSVHVVSKHLSVIVSVVIILGLLAIYQKKSHLYS